jgi:hypothetical protein
MRPTTLGRFARLTAALTCAAMAACTWTVTSTGTPRPDHSSAQRVFADEPAGSRSLVLTDSELTAADATTLTEAIEHLRPQFLRGSARPMLSGPAEIAVYLNGLYNGDLSSLLTIPVSEVRRITFMHPMEARSHFGTMCRCASGALLVSTRFTASP